MVYENSENKSESVLWSSINVGRLKSLFKDNFVDIST